MQTKNKTIYIIIFLLSGLFSSLNSLADEFNITAKEVSFDKENNEVIANGAVEVTDDTGKLIKGNKAVYNKTKEFLTIEGNVSILDSDGNILKTEKAEYEKLKNIITTYKNSKLSLNENYNLTSNKLIYDTLNKKISSNTNSVLTDIDNNVISVSMFQYHIKKNLFSSVGKIKFVDAKKNKYFFKELFVDTIKKEIIGSDVSVILDKKNFGVSEENDPRFVSNDIYVSKQKSYLSKGVFTVCQKKDGKCPPWSLQAKKITHDQVRKTIHYDHAVLKVYNIPIFYFPKFFHPDPTVKRTSGFLSPIFTNTTSLGTGFGLPYFWAISHDKDLTFSPKLYSNENPIFINEYRQAFRNGSLTLDSSYTQGYQNITSAKTKGSRSHLFGDLKFNLSSNDEYESNIDFKIQRTSNDTYFRVHDINTSLVDAESTNLKNEINYYFSKENFNLKISGAVYENLRVKNNSRYEYILPNVSLDKTFVTEKYGLISFNSEALYRNYNVNHHLSTLNNKVIWNPSDRYTQKGFVNNIEGILMNTNYEATNIADHKSGGVINELSAVIKYKSSLPLKKEKKYSSNIFSPTFMIRYAPGHMRNLSGDNVILKHSNLYATNKTSVIEDGLSAVLGFDFSISNKDKNNIDREKLSLSLGQVFTHKKNKNMPYKSSLDQKMSDVVGEIQYNFSELSTLNYKFSVDHNLNDLNYNEISTNLNFGKIDFNLDYLEEQNHIGKEHYVSSGITLNLDSKNKFKFETKKNFQTSSAEYYDMSYQYTNDCLTAGLLYRREFYEDSDIEQNDNLMFTITFVPFTGIKAPLIKP